MQSRAGASMNLVDAGTGEIHAVPSSTIVNAFVDGELQVKGRKPSSDRIGSSLGWDDIPERERSIAEYRYEVIKPFIGLGPSERVQAIRQYVATRRVATHSQEDELQTAVSVPSIYRWLKALKEGDGAIQALIPKLAKRGNKTSSRINPETESIMEQVINDLSTTQLQVGIDTLYQKTLSQIRDENRYRKDKLPAVSRSTVARRVKQKDIDGKLTLKRNRRALNLRTTQYDTLRPAEFPLDRVEIDHTILDVIVVDEINREPIGRPTLTLALDVCTKWPLGFYTGFEPPSFDTIQACLIHGILPKEGYRDLYGTQRDWLAFGVPETLVVDNGRDFAGRNLEDACVALGIELERMPVRTPHYKGSVERFFRTLNTGLIHSLPGTTFSNAVERGDYQSEKEAALTLGELDRLIVKFIVDVYAEDLHTGIEAIPARHWERFVNDGFLQRLESRESLIINLGRIDYATLHHYGIDFKTIRYNLPTLGPLRARLEQTNDRKVKFKYNPRDLGAIFVFDRFEERYIEVPTLNPDYACGLSLWQHSKIRKYTLQQRDRPNPADLGEVKRALDQEIEAAKHATGARAPARARKGYARWQENSRARSGLRNPASPHDNVVISAIAEDQSASSSERYDLDWQELKEAGWTIPVWAEEDQNSTGDETEG